MIWMNCGQVSFTNMTCEVHSRKVQWKSPPAPASHSQFCKCSTHLCVQLSGQLDGGTDAKESGFARWNFLITKATAARRSTQEPSLFPSRMPLNQVI